MTISEGFDEELTEGVSVVERKGNASEEILEDFVEDAFTYPTEETVGGLREETTSDSIEEVLENSTEETTMVCTDETMEDSTEETEEPLE